jgi:hypothetical protein
LSRRDSVSRLPRGASFQFALPANRKHCVVMLHS